MAIFTLNKKPEEPAEDLGPSATETKEFQQSDTTNEISGIDDVPVDQDTKERSITLDGPLSKAYTEALNQIYALEGMVADGTVNDSYKDKYDNTYVYAVDADDLDMEETNTAIHKLRLALDSGDKVMLAIESHGKVTSNITLLDEFSSGNDISVSFNQRQFLSQLAV